MQQHDFLKWKQCFGDEEVSWLLVVVVVGGAGGVVPSSIGILEPTTKAKLNQTCVIVRCLCFS